MNIRLLSFCAAIYLGMAGWSGVWGALEISAPDFVSGQPMPDKYAKDHGNISPALRMKGVPEGAKSLALIVSDPDAPRDKAGTFTHWLVWNIDPQHALFLEGRPPRGAIQGRNSFGDLHYDGPKPPSGTHRYFFDLYALNVSISLPADVDRAKFDAAMKRHIIARATMFGTYQAGH